MEKRKKLLKKIIIRASNYLAGRFGKITVAHSDAKLGIPVNLVSEADKNTQDMLVKEIRKVCPEDSILAEEGDLAQSQEHMKKGGLWVIDPLDGTVNFLHGFPYFAVSIAYCENGQPVLSAITDPIRGELFWAEKGKGTTLFQFAKWDEKAKPKSSRKLKVTQTKKVKDSLLVTGFGYDRREKADFYLSYYKTFLKICHDVRRTGAACLDLAWVSAGRVDGFWEAKLSPWDVAAGQLLVQEAGGRLSHFDGSPYSIFRSQEMLATNGKIHAECLELIGETETGRVA